MFLNPILLLSKVLCARKQRVRSFEDITSCLQIYGENENECIECHKNNKEFLDEIKSQENSSELHQVFHNELEKGTDSFGVVSDYLRRGVFNKVPVTSPAAPPARPPNTDTPEHRFLYDRHEEQKQKKQMEYEEVHKTITAPPPVVKSSNPFDLADDSLEIPSQPVIIERKSPARDSSSQLAYIYSESTQKSSPKVPEPAPLVINSNPFDDDDDDVAGVGNENSTNPFANEADDDNSTTRTKCNDELNPFA